MKATKTPKLNVRLLRRVQKHILKEPRRLLMSHWVNRDPIKRDANTDPPCGTTACIAGWSLTLAGKRLRFGVDYIWQGQKQLGLSDVQAQNLFFVDRWPTKFISKYNAAVESYYTSELPTLSILRKNAKVAVARIDHFIKTRE